MNDDDPMKNEAVKFLRDELFRVHLESGRRKDKSMLELRKFRAQIPTATTTVLLLIAPFFAKEDITFIFLFKLAYITLALSTIGGFLGIEGLLRSEILSYDSIRQRAMEVLKTLKATNDPLQSLKEFSTEKEQSRLSKWSNEIAEWSMRLFILGLILLFISIFPV